MKKIRTPDELLNITSNGEYELVADIDLSGKVTKCIIDEFDGVLEGNGHTIKNLHIEDVAIMDGQEIAPIHRARYAKISNVNFDNVFIDVEHSVYHPHFATLISETDASILENVRVSTNNDMPMICISYDTRYDNVRYNSTNKMVKEIVD